MSIAVLYVLFAIFAILVNIATQILVFRVVWFAYAVPVSVAAGTLTGLVTKYLLDRNYVFHASPGPKRKEWRSFLMYVGTGALTTIIFWTTEFVFHYAFQAEMYRYLGGVLGLSLGYVVKYRLDRDLVFHPVTLKEKSAQRYTPT